MNKCERRLFMLSLVVLLTGCQEPLDFALRCRDAKERVTFDSGWRDTRAEAWAAMDENRMARIKPRGEFCSIDVRKKASN